MTGGKARPVALELNHAPQSEALCQRILMKLAGWTFLSTARRSTLKHSAGHGGCRWDRVIETNLSGAFRLARAAANSWLLGRWGRIH